MILSIIGFQIDQEAKFFKTDYIFGFGQMFNFVLMLILAEYSSIAKRLDLKNFWYRPNVWLWPNVKKLRFGNSLD